MFADPEWLCSRNFYFRKLRRFVSLRQILRKGLPATGGWLPCITNRRCGFIVVLTICGDLTDLFVGKRLPARWRLQYNKQSCAIFHRGSHWIASHYNRTTVRSAANRFRDWQQRVFFVRFIIRRALLTRRWIYRRARTGHVVSHHFLL